MVDVHHVQRIGTDVIAVHQPFALVKCLASYPEKYSESVRNADAATARDFSRHNCPS